MSENAIINSLDPIKPVARFLLTAEKNFNYQLERIATPDSALPDFVGSFDSIKHLLKLLDAEEQPNQPTGLTLHKLGNCIVLDHAVTGGCEAAPSSDQEYDLDDELVLLPTSLVEELSAGLPRTAALRDVSVKNTFIHFADQDPAVLPRYHSAPPGGVQDAPPLHVSPPRAIKESVMTGLLRLPPPSPSGELRLPFLDPDQLSPISRVNRAVEWNIAGFSMLLGCEVVVMDPSDQILPSKLSAVKLLARGECWPSRAAARQAWLESSLLQVDSVAWVCGSNNSVELVTSTAELSIEADIDGMVDSIQRVLQFLHKECRSQGSTYCLVRESDGSCLLYDVSALPSECDVLQVSAELALPIAKVCYSLGAAATCHQDKQNLLRKSWKLAERCEEADLCALVALELHPVDVAVLTRALELNHDWASDVMQKLLVSIATAIRTSNGRLAWLMLGRALLGSVSQERIEVECRNLLADLEAAIARALVAIRSPEELRRLECEIAALPLRNRIEIPHLPTERMGRLELAIDLSVDDRFTHAVCLNELGAELILAGDAEQSIKHLVDALRTFIYLENEGGTVALRPLYLAVLMNLSRVFKLASLKCQGNSAAVVNHLRAIVFVRIAHKLNRDAVPESIVGVELMALGEDLARSVASGTSDLSATDDPLVKSAKATIAILGSSETLTKAVKSVTNRKLGKLSLNDLSVTADDLSGSSAWELARNAFELSLLFAEEPDRPVRRAEVDFWIAKLMAERAEQASESMRHITRAMKFFENAGEREWLSKALCLKATVEYMQGLAQTAVTTLIPHADDPTIRDCLKAICLRDIKTQQPYKHSKAILEAILRNRDLTPWE